jgi:hypothetical protein
MSNGGFHSRSFVSLIITWAFLTLVVSGAVLYIAPPGRIANWTGWQLLFLTKGQWQSIHTLTAILFLIGSAFHLLKFNWKSLIAHLQKRKDAKRPFHYELLSSLALFLLIAIGALTQRAPFQTVMDAGESIRESWEPSDKNPPIPHMEQMAVKQLADSLHVETPQVIQFLDQLGLKPASAEERLEDLAKRNGQSPEQIYRALRIKLKSAAAPAKNHLSGVEADMPPGSGRGQGFRSLAELAQEYGLSPEAAVQKLATHGIQAAPQEIMREVAIRNNRKPYELLEILKEGTGK